MLVTILSGLPLTFNETVLWVWHFVGATPKPSLNDDNLALTVEFTSGKTFSVDTHTDDNRTSLDIDCKESVCNISFSASE